MYILSLQVLEGKYLEAFAARYSEASTLTFVIGEEEDEDNMEEIDTDNIIQDGRRTRGKTIDFAKAAENADDIDDDEEDDEDFEAPDDTMKE